MGEEEYKERGAEYSTNTNAKIPKYIKLKDTVKKNCQSNAKKIIFLHIVVNFGTSSPSSIIGNKKRFIVSYLPPV